MKNWYTENSNDVSCPHCDSDQVYVSGQDYNDLHVKVTEIWVCSACDDVFEREV